MWTGNAVRMNYDVRKPISCLSFHPEHRLAAVGCLGEVKILRIDRTAIVSELCNFTSPTPKSILADVSWSNDARKYLALAYNTGEIKVINLTNAPIPSTEPIMQSKYENSINRIVWHPTEQHTIASADNKGFLRLYDIRINSTNNIIYNTRFMTHQTRNARDIQFNPTHTDLFAAVADNHYAVRLWDRRVNKSHVMESLQKEDAHKQGITSMAWSPVEELVFATGSLDKTIKVWDAGRCSVPLSTSSTSQSSSATHVSEPLLLSTIYANAEVSKVSWAIDPYSQQAFISHLSQNCPPYQGLVRLFSPPRNYLPVCVLPAYEKDQATSMCWIPCQESVSAESAAASAPAKSKGGKKNQRPKAPQTQSSQGGEEQVDFLRYLLTGGKDGHLLVLDPRGGHFPHSLISPTITAISSGGHVAYHRGEKYLPQSLFFTAEKVQKPSATIPSAGNKTGRSSPLPLDSSPFPPVYSPTEHPLGRVFLGHAQLHSLEVVQYTRRLNTAEASVYDPALISLLATLYRLSPYMPPSNKGSEQGGGLTRPASNEVLLLRGEDRDSRGEEEEEEEKKVKEYAYKTSLETCQFNYEVSKRAGLDCRAALWASLLALLPPPNRSKGLDLDAKIGKEVLLGILKDLLEIGDAQHFVLVAEIIRKLRCLQPSDYMTLPFLQVRRIYLSYLELLRKLKLFCKANEIIKGGGGLSQTDEVVIGLTQRDVEYVIKCGKCRKEITGGTGGTYCINCNRMGTECAVCQEIVSGAYVMCPVCCHGGHYACLLKWHTLYETCPLGCGHSCTQCLPNDIACIMQQEGGQKRSRRRGRKNISSQSESSRRRVSVRNRNRLSLS